MNARSLVRRSGVSKDWRMRALYSLFLGFILVICIRLFDLQVVQASFYDQLASGQHDFYKELFAERGSIYVKDWKEGLEYVAATNEPRAFVFADPRKIEDPVATALAVGGILGYELPQEVEEVTEPEPASDILDGVLAEEESTEVTPEVEMATVEQESPNEINLLIERFSKKDDPYEPVARDVDDATLQKILSLNIEGIDYILESGRSYPEKNLGGHVFGFVGATEDGSKKGNYGIEGYFDEFLAGENGFLNTQTDIAGRWIGVGTRHFDPAKDGGDVLLTIDRTIQYEACDALKRGVEAYQADGGAVVIIEPSTGRIMAMCSAPDFDPQNYSEVEDISVYNNRTIFESYEPGSVFKPIVMSAALDQGVVTPTTLFNDTGEEKIDEYTIRNSDLKAHGLVSMTEILEMSLNTGMIHVMRLLTGPTMLSYIENFGFGKITGIELPAESSGTIDALYNDHEIYYATASYGQGITTTPLQLAVAYGALANGGELMRPYIVEEKRYDDGRVELTRPEVVRTVISSKTATTIGAMLVSVIENGHGGQAAVPGYYIAGKTGTAQVAKTSGVGYETGVTKATFAGFGPVEDPVFAMVVYLDHPRTSPWAESTSAPIFGEIADFLLHYLEVAPRRATE